MPIRNIVFLFLLACGNEPKTSVPEITQKDTNILPGNPDSIPVAVPDSTDTIRTLVPRQKENMPVIIPR
jgi:hypothetical protein